MLVSPLPVDENRRLRENMKLNALKVVPLVPFVLLAVLAGCDKKSGGQLGAAESQVVAQVNGGEISVHQVQTLLRLQPALTARWGEQASTKALDTLVEQELAAQAATDGGLDKSPQVIQAMTLARREVLARAYQDQLAEKITPPDSGEISQYYDQHPELFSQRRQYHMIETAIKAEGAQLDAMAAAAEGKGSVDEFQAWLGQQKVPSSSRRAAQWAENLPLELLPKLSKLKAGQSMALKRPDGLLVLTVTQLDDAPVTLPQATPAIYTVLSNQRRQQAVREGMTRLREQAKITRMAMATGSASQAASGAQGASGAASAAPAAVASASAGQAPASAAASAP